jgi:hypothetical protein
MTNYPTAIDSDRTIIRIDDNLSELGSSAINQLREAVFAIERTLGINPNGSKSSVNDRISILIGPDGNPRAEALQAIGLATLPITNVQVAINAGIQEIKLALDFSTSDLKTDIVFAQSNITIIQGLLADENTNLLTHISGGSYLVDGITQARHVASHIDINAVGTDSRDTYTWAGLLDVNGNLRSATQVAAALLEINNELVSHENASTSLVHPASAISIDASEFLQLPTDITNVQDAFRYVDDIETLSSGVDRATLHSNGIPRTARIQDLRQDGYTINVVPVTKINTYLAAPSALSPNDNISNGDDVVQFIPNNTGFEFDSKFSHVQVGDILRINYGAGLEGVYPIVAVRFIAGTEWAVRINTHNLFNDGYDGYDGYARIDRPAFDTQTCGVFAAAGITPNILTNQPYLNSVVIGSPRGASAVGFGFNAGQIDSAHYNLYLRLYPNGDSSIFYDLPAIDVSGNGGLTPGYYNIDIVVEAINRKFSTSGYNYRFIAFNYKGEFGIMLADDYNGVSFSIISGQLNYLTGILETGSYTQNVIGDATDSYDALGLGFNRSGVASPVMSRAGVAVPYPTTIAAANYHTRIISPVGGRNVIINGNRRDFLAKPQFTEGDGYWPAVISSVVADIPNNTNEVTYSISLDLATETLVPGKTIVVQPEVVSNTTIKDYGRFIIETVSFSCTGAGQTNITVLNAIHGTANSNQAPLTVGTRVKIYFSDDSVMFNLGNMAGSDGSSDPADYHHYHEVFVSDIGHSVAIERARIPHSNTGSIPSLPGSGNIGALSEWRVRRVSPLLKGYRSGVTDFRYFVWLWIDNYDTTTGEFDIYLFDLTWNRGGPLTRGKKNYPVRVYDESYVNFIDLEFREDASRPGTTIPTGFVAIELFSTLKENDEHFAVAGVSHDGITFKSITDLRDFGTISEENLSDSAISFIQSGERYLHTNGVVRGFAYRGDSIGSTLLFNGGIALVNGAFVPVDAMSVTLPELTATSGVVEYFVCVTETGHLQAVVKGTGAQFFDSTYNNFVESLTFKEIVDTRKDLTVIAKAVVTMGSGLVVVTDARRHIVNQDLESYTWEYSSGATYGTDPLFHSANFITPEAVMNWVNEYNVKEVNVKTVTINSKLTMNFTSPVILNGGVYYINSVQGLSFTSGDWKINNAEIIYNPTNGVYDTGDFFNVKNNWGAILVDLGAILTSNISNFGIENSKFSSSAAQRPPFVGIYSATGYSYNVFTNGRFVNNTFSDTTDESKALCYAFINGNTPNVSSNAPYFADILVSDTKINFGQGILISGRATPNSGAGGYSAINSVLIENFIIRDNRFGFIGFNVNNWIGTYESGRFIIENNRVDMIYSGITATMNTTTSTFGDYTRYSTGNSVSFVVRNNECSFMKIETSAGADQLKSSIIGNNIRSWNTDMLNALIPDPVPYAMVIESQGLYPTNVTIANNTIDGWAGSGYLHSIFIEGAGANITGNVINNIAAGGYGIWNYGTTAAEHSTIVGNTLHKADGVAIAGYISSSTNAAIYGNTLSHANLAFWSDGGTDFFDGYGETTTSNFNGITGAGAQFAAWNVNQVVRTVPNMASAIPLFHISPISGTVVGGSDENNERLLYGGSGQYINKGLQKVNFTENNGWVWRWAGGGVDINDGTVGLIIPLVSVLPDRAYLLSASIHVYFSGQWDITNNNHTTAHTTFPQVSLELNGNMVDSRNPFTDPNADPSYTDVTLNYQSEALITGTRPAAPLIKEMVVKMRQGEPSDGLVYGGWLGPTGSGSQTMRIGQVWISYMY